MARLFTAADLDQIEAAVTEAESHSDGEIAIVIAPQSRSWLADPLLVGSMVGLLAILIGVWWTRQSSWTGSFDAGTTLILGACAFAAVFLLYLPLIRPRARKRAIWNGAMAAFNRLEPTRAQTAVLIYISVAEKDCAIIADKGIAARLDDRYWDEPYAMVHSGLTGGTATDGVIQAVKAMGAKLAEHFPRSPDDTDELPNRPVVG